mgnify:FL=1
MDKTACFAEFVRGKRTLLVPHAHEDSLEFIEVLRGTARIHAGLDEFSVSAGEILHLVPGIVHYAEAENGECYLRTLTYRQSAVFLAGRFEREIFSLFLMQTENRILRFSAEDPLRAQLSAHMENAVSEYLGKELMYGSLVLAEVCHMAALLLRSYSYGTEGELPLDGMMRLRPALEYIEGHYAEKLTLAGLSSLLSLSPDRFGRFFRETVGVTPIDYINTVRIGHAMQELLRSDEPVFAVAHACGFPDSGHFHRVFRERCGTTPASLRLLRRRMREDRGEEE